MKKKYLIIGSNSFSGASFAAFLLGKGHEVLGSSRSAEPHEAFLPYRWSADQGKAFRFFQHDINTDVDGLMKCVERERPQVVVNFAAQGMVAESWRNPDQWMTTNVVSTVRLHERLRHCDFLERYVQFTTPEVYGNTSDWIKEDAPFHPTTPYAVSRAASDMSLRTFVDAYGFPGIATRTANVFGAGQQLYRIVPRTVLFVRLGRKLQLHGGGHSRRSFIHADDVSDAVLRIAQDGRTGETYHISTNRMISIRDLVALICERMHAAYEDHVEVVEERLGKDFSYMLDSSKVRNQLGWEDKVSLEAGIDQTIAWVDRYLDALKSLPFDYIHKA